MTASLWRREATSDVLLQGLDEENDNLREQLIELSRSISRVQNQAADEEISSELKLLLASIPVTSLPVRRYSM